MEICFYNMNHIGDIYFNYFFINLLCKQNFSKQFYYCFINGDIFFKDIKNISKISPVETTYSNILTNGSPPEDLLNNIVHNLLLQNNMENIMYKKLFFSNKEYLFVNLWCASELLLHSEFNFSSAISSYNNLIYNLNYNFKFNLNYKINNISELIEDIDINNKIYKCEFENLNKIQFNETIIIFNFKPRSVNFNMILLNNLIFNLSKDNKIILTTYDAVFDNNINITFIDKDYNIKPNPSCDNLLHIWEIAIKCKKIIILPSGSSFLFFHKLNEIKENQIYMFNNVEYLNILNNNIKFFINKEVIQLIN
jgi:hypothetical protein